MKLLYTDVRTPLTQVLTQEAVGLVEQGKRVFYIAPNSLSFEKEAKVLSYLEGQASFAITVTRFAQMARYFILNQVFEEQPLDDIGLGMLFFKALSQMKEQDLKVYGALRKDPQFIQQLVQLYHELQTAQMDFTDLELLEEAEKERTSWRFLKRSLRCWSSTSMNPSPRWPFSSIRSKKGSWKSNYRMWRSLSMASRVFLQKKRL